MTRAKPELLAPAGNWDCARAAVANGADAVYFGLPQFNARLRADNFTLTDLPPLVAFLHQHRVRAYVTLNTLIFTHELSEVERFLQQLQNHGVDAIIVQDLGLVQLARAVAPDVAVHASTQMTVTSPEGARFAARLGVTRVVLAREVSLREMARFNEVDLPPLEVFVHGALCVAYSGQCLTSESLGQRSANRGECAQACRLPYQIIVDGVVRDLGPRTYLLSPQDLAAVAEIPALLELGVQSFKIEGRLKTPEYVAAVCQVYRRALDAAWAQQTATLSTDDSYKLEMSFSRGLFSGWMHGVNHQRLVHGRYSNKRGPVVGRITGVGPDHVEIAPTLVPLQLGDGLLFDTGGDQNEQQGGRLFERRGHRLYFQHGKIDFTRLQPGAEIYKTDDPKLKAALKKSFQGDLPAPKISVDFQVTGQVGQPLHIRAACDRNTFSVQSAMPLTAAHARPLDSEKLREQLGRLGTSRFALRQLDNRLNGAVILPVRELNRLRRELVEQLEKHVISTVAEVRLTSRPALEKLLPLPMNTGNDEVILTVLCRSLEQLRVLLQEGARRFYVDFEDVRRYRDAVALVREFPAARIYLATPRIQKATEQGFFKLIEAAQPDGVLARNLGALHYFHDHALPCVADFSLNVANPLTAQILQREGVERMTISYDLNAEQVGDLLRAAPAAWFEIVLHQHMPMFHMEHCVFAAFLSEGTDHTNCGRPCDRHQIKLRDRVGLDHPVLADVGCRNTVYHGRAQSGAGFLSTFRQAGACAFRLELLQEDGGQTGRIYRAYHQLLRGEIVAGELVTQLKVANQLGVTSGTLTVL